MSIRYSDRHGRFSKQEIAEILSLGNRTEAREKLKRAPHTDDLIEHWLDKRKGGNLANATK